MSNCTEREFGRNVTNAPVGKTAFVGLPLTANVPQWSGAVERTRQPQKRNDREEGHEDAAHVVTAVGAKRRCTEEGILCQPPCGAVAQVEALAVKQRPVMNPACSISGSVSSIEACFDEGVEASRESSPACAELLRAVEEAETAVMVDLRCVCGGAPGSLHSPLLLESTSSPPVIPLLY
ncbi:hypothetical protein TcG_01749 [Trypanosoma cruzi]|nr:hypothetical protein TcG_01749 [Trypanosoma cruzi]